MDDIKCSSYDVDGNTRYINGKDIEEIIQSLEEALKMLLDLFTANLMKNTANKCPLLVHTSDKVNIRIENLNISYIKSEKLLEINFHRKFPFIGRISDLCKKARQNIYAVKCSLNVLARLVPYMTL